jgi:uncharacterized protein (TIGR03083 family)
VLDAMRAERAAFLALLRTLTPDEWRAPTECPAYDVQGVATHVLGDDFSLLSRQRDGAPPGVLSVMEGGVDFRTALDRFNDRWVEAAGFFSSTLLIELLELTGRWTADWYESVPPEALGEPVGFFAADGPSPYWQIAAREYVERWVHHHQIRRALGRPDLDDEPILRPAAGSVLRAIAAHLHGLDVPEGGALAVVVEDLASWCLVRGDGRWRIVDGGGQGALATLRLDRGLATSLLSRGLTRAEVEAALSTEGDAGVAAKAVRGVAAITGRS